MLHIPSPIMPRKRKQTRHQKQPSHNQQSPRRSSRLKNKNNASHGHKMHGDKYYLFSHKFINKKKSKLPSPYPIISRCKRKMKLIHHKPNVFVIDNFLTDNEINHLLAIANNSSSKFQISYTQSNNTNEQIYSKERTSTFIFLQKYMDQISRRIERRAADIVSIPVENVEPLQLVRYTEGQQFTLHHDGGTLVDLESSSNTSSSSLWSLSYNETSESHMGIDIEDMSAPESSTESAMIPSKLCQNCSQKGNKCQIESSNYCVELVKPVRLFSYFVYLTTIPIGDGGETIFPDLGIKVRPERGKAILWSNVCPNNIYKPCTRTVHRAYPIKGKTQKIGMNIWIDANRVATDY